MKKLLALFVALSLTGCGQIVTVSPHEVGKILTPTGYKNGTISASRFRLDPCVSVCDKLVTVETSDFEVKEQMNLFMPKDDLTMEFDVRLVLALDQTELNKVFTKVPPVSNNNGYSVQIHKVYNIYAKTVVRTVSRNVMSQYKISEVASSREAVGAILAKKITEEIKLKTPFIARQVGLSHVAYPDIIVKAKELAAQRREEIEQEKAQSQKEFIRLERDLTAAQKQRKVDVERAKAEAEVNKILADSMTPAYEKYRKLNALDSIANSNNTKFIPVEMLGSMAGQVMMGNQK